MSKVLRVSGAVVLIALALSYIVYVDASARADASPTNEPTADAQDPVSELAGSDARVLRIGWTAWADAEIVTQLAQRLLSERLGYRVKLVMADIGIQYQSVASGDLDIMLMAWLPMTHRSYWNRVSDKVLDVGVLYTRTRLGWVVPQYVPEGELSSFDDLRKPEVQAKLGGKLVGIDPGSGLMQASERAIHAYDLDGLSLVASSGAAMTAALDRAIERHQWIVATAWSPHWIFAKYQLRYLRDPKGILGRRERVHAIARRGFYQDFDPELTEFFSRLYLPLPELEAALLWATQGSVDTAVDRYIAEHPGRIEYWLTGEVPRSRAQ